MGRPRKSGFKIIELTTPRSVPPLDKDSKRAISALSGSPGFQYLVAKLNLVNSALKTQLNHTRHETLREVDFIQSGIFWSGWLQAQVALATEAVHNTESEALPFEVEAFQEAQKLIELVGQEPPQAE